MFVRNGEVLGSALHGAEPNTQPTPDVSPEVVAEPDNHVPSPELEWVAQADPPDIPARNGSRSAWAEFLDLNGIEYDPDPEVDGRNDLIAKWDSFNENNSWSER